MPCIERWYFPTVSAWQVLQSTGEVIVSANSRVTDDVLAQADEAGLVHAGANSKHLSNICNCCPCCCLYGILPHMAPHMAAAVTAMPGVEVRVTDRCTGCGLCVDNCPFKCWVMEEGAIPELKEDYACFSCSNCMVACPTEAIVLGDNYELSFVDRREAIYTKERLIVPVPEGGIPVPQVTEPGMFTRSVPEMEDPQD